MLQDIWCLLFKASYLFYALVNILKFEHFHAKILLSSLGILLWAVSENGPFAPALDTLTFLTMTERIEPGGEICSFLYWMLSMLIQMLMCQITT